MNGQHVGAVQIHHRRLETPTHLGGGNVEGSPMRHEIARLVGTLAHSGRGALHGSQRPPKPIPQLVRRRHGERDDQQVADFALRLDDEPGGQRGEGVRFARAGAGFYECGAGAIQGQVEWRHRGGRRHVRCLRAACTRGVISCSASSPKRALKGPSPP